jgi:hypothetical protein
VLLVEVREASVPLRIPCELAHGTPPRVAIPRQSIFRGPRHKDEFEVVIMQARRFSWGLPRRTLGQLYLGGVSSFVGGIPFPG